MNQMQVFVTGGSRGIGQAIVELLAQKGFQVGFSYTSQKASAEAVLAKLPGAGHFCLQLNQENEESVESATTQILQKFPTLYGLVNNAGVTRDQLFLRMKQEDFDTVMNVNLRGVFMLTKAFSRHFLKQRKGSIVNISSVIGQTGNVGQVNYSAAKAGLLGMSRSLALEFAPRGVRVNCVAPGFIATEMTAQLSEDAKAKIISRIPLEKIGEGVDVAQAVRFLLSDESKFITGHTLSVNGGMYME